MKLFLSADDTIVYVQNPKGSTEKKKKGKKKNHQTPRISELSMVAGYKMNIQKWVAFEAAFPSPGQLRAWQYLEIPTRERDLKPGRGRSRTRLHHRSRPACSTGERLSEHTEVLPLLTYWPCSVRSDIKNPSSLCKLHQHLQMRTPLTGLCILLRWLSWHLR